MRWSEGTGDIAGTTCGPVYGRGVEKVCGSDHLGGSGKGAML